jgi:hypothetical protein
MSGLPPLDVHDHKMLPAVYRRSDIARPANIAGRQSRQGLPEGQLVPVGGGAEDTRYTRPRNNSPMVVRTGSSRLKGMIVDVWA